MKLDDLQPVAIALSANVEAGAVHPVILKGQELAIWRDSCGTLHLWEDRCPHRGMRLSFGFVRNDRLTCLYHGWEFGEGGGCKRIPAHPDLEPPETLCANPFSVSEAFGMVFLNAVAGDDALWFAVRSVVIDAPMQSILKTLPDLAEWKKTGPVFLGRFKDARLALAIQDISETETALHLTTTSADSDLRIALARALVAYRTKLIKEIA